MLFVVAGQTDKPTLGHRVSSQLSGRGVAPASAKSVHFHQDVQDKTSGQDMFILHKKARGLDIQWQEQHPDDSSQVVDDAINGAPRQKRQVKRISDVSPNNVFGAHFRVVDGIGAMLGFKSGLGLNDFPVVFTGEDQLTLEKVKEIHKEASLSSMVLLPDSAVSVQSVCCHTTYIVPLCPCPCMPLVLTPTSILPFAPPLLFIWIHLSCVVTLTALFNGWTATSRAVAPRM